MGNTMLPIDAEPRETWTYYYEKGTVSADNSRSGELNAESNRIFLFVYFKERLYDGYMWFSSLNDEVN